MSQCYYVRHFDTSKAINVQSEAAKLFSVPDFVGDMCKAIASRVRGAVASVSFDDFHKVCYAFETPLTVLRTYTLINLETPRCCS